MFNGVFCYSDALHLMLVAVVWYTCCFLLLWIHLHKCHTRKGRKREGREWINCQTDPPSGCFTNWTSQEKGGLALGQTQGWAVSLRERERERDERKRWGWGWGWRADQGKTGEKKIQVTAAGEAKFFDRGIRCRSAFTFLYFSLQSNEQRFRNKQLQGGHKNNRVTKWTTCGLAKTTCNLQEGEGEGERRL